MASERIIVACNQRTLEWCDGELTGDEAMSWRAQAASKANVRVRLHQIGKQFRADLKSSDLLQVLAALSIFGLSETVLIEAPERLWEALKAEQQTEAFAAVA